jgi:lipoprotein Spr
MKNIFKIVLFTIICTCSSYAGNDFSTSVLNTKNDVFHLICNDTVKNSITDPKKTNPRKKIKLIDKNADDIFIDTEEEKYIVSQLINVASDNLGIHYRAGGITKNGFDCSGLMYSTFKMFDITLPRSSHEMAEIGSQIDVKEAKKGDLIFFINRGQKRINHVGMIVEVNGDEIKFIHSSTQSGVVISSLKESYYDRTFKQINRVIQ